MADRDFRVRSRKPADHVQAAVAQARNAVQVPATQQLAPHVRAVIAHGAQAKPGPHVSNAASAAPNRQPATHVQSAIERTNITGTIQRAQDLQSRYEAFEQKRASMETTGQVEGVWVESVKQYGGQASLDEIAGTVFSSLGSRVTGAVAFCGNTLYVASQQGHAAKNLEAIQSKLAVLGKTIVAADAVLPDRSHNMHAEMLIVYHCLTNGIDPGTLSAVGVKDKGCCRLCSAALSHLDIAFTRTEESKYEVQWQDPWEHAKKPSPLGQGSGLSISERRLLG